MVRTFWPGRKQTEKNRLSVLGASFPGIHEFCCIELDFGQDLIRVQSAQSRQTGGRTLPLKVICKAWPKTVLFRAPDSIHNLEHQIARATSLPAREGLRPQNASEESSFGGILLCALRAADRCQPLNSNLAQA